MQQRLNCAWRYFSYHAELGRATDALMCALRHRLFGPQKIWPAMDWETCTLSCGTFEELAVWKVFSNPPQLSVSSFGQKMYHLSQLQQQAQLEPWIESSPIAENICVAVQCYIDHEIFERVSKIHASRDMFFSMYMRSLTEWVLHTLLQSFMEFECLMIWIDVYSMSAFLDLQTDFLSDLLSTTQWELSVGKFINKEMAIHFFLHVVMLRYEVSWAKSETLWPISPVIDLQSCAVFPKIFWVAGIGFWVVFSLTLSHHCWLVVPLD